MINSEPRYKVTPDRIDGYVLAHHNEIFVYASNTEGRHGSGSARTAFDEFGARHGVAMGLVGQCYGIITKDFATFNPKSPEYVGKMLEFIQSQVKTLYEFATYRPELHFYVTAIGTGLAGLNVVAIRDIFNTWNIPSNVILPKKFIQE